MPEVDDGDSAIAPGTRVNVSLDDAAHSDLPEISHAIAIFVEDPAPAFAAPSEKGSVDQVPAAAEAQALETESMDQLDDEKSAEVETCRKKCKLLGVALFLLVLDGLLAIYFGT